MYPSAKDWAYIRSELMRYMPDIVSIYSVSISYSSENGETRTRTVVASGVSAKVYDASGSEKQLIQALLNAGVETIETAKIDLPYSVTLEPTHEVLHNGKYWNVVSTNSNQTYKGMTQGLLYRRSVNNQLVN